jgi:hypothetical protein
MTATAHHCLSAMRTVWALTAAAALAGCASAPVISLRGSPTDWRAWAGEWDGTYAGIETGRSGTLWFKLVAGEDHAHGDVQISATGAEPYMRFPPGNWPMAQPVERQHFIPIRFARADGDLIEGQLDPYWDPAFASDARTTFRGTLSEGWIRGSFVTRYSNGRSATGQWEAARRR